MPRNSINAQIKLLMEADEVPVEPLIINQYKELNSKCDTVITKIKKRKKASKQEKSTIKET